MKETEVQVSKEKKNNRVLVLTTEIATNFPKKMNHNGKGKSNH
jgi:hypothetical protein